MPKGKQTLSGRIAVVTGANRGIGFAIAKTFAGEGAQCVLVVRDREAGEKAAQSIAGAGVALAPVVTLADVADRAQVTVAALEISQRFRTVDLLVNNAGVLLQADRQTPISRMDMVVYEETMATNVIGAIAMSQVFLQYMRDGARIINVSSTMGQLSDGSAGYAPAYCISKTALNAVTQHLAAELWPKGIMVDCFHPGWAKTELGGPNATVEPDQAAQVALFLATRPKSEKTGLFWRHPGIVIDW